MTMLDEKVAVVPRSSRGPAREGDEATMASHTLGTRDEWLAARLELLEAERELTRRSDELARRDYRFATEDGDASLRDLFGGRSQMLVYHFMFGPDWDEGCPSCSAVADGFAGSIPHFEHHDVAFVVVSRAPLDKLVAYKRRMGWDFRWVSSFGSSFNYDFHVTIDPAVAPVEYNYKDQAQLEAENVAWRDWSGEQPGMSAFARDDDVFHTYSAYARGFDGLWTMWQWLDRAPLGRNEGDLSWFHRHDDTPRPRADRRDTRTYRGDASRGMVDAVHHLRGCRASWHARHDNVGQEHAIGVRHEHTPDRVAAGVGGCAPATAREGEGVDPRP